MNVAICIPMYKNKIDCFEKVALLQVDRVLRDYDKYFIVPEGYVPEIDFIDGQYFIEDFERSFFDSQEKYSELMLSIDFYKRFIQYDYILLYQLDAFIFYDNLDEVCNWDYDYVGAPGIVTPPLLGSLFTKDIFHHWENGGLSLRKVSSFINALAGCNFDAIPQKSFLMKAEDVFFSYISTSNDFSFKMAPVEDALRFSVEFNLANCFSSIKDGEKPLGTHAWYKMNYDLWKPIIESYGYELPDIDKSQYTDNRYRSDLLWKFYSICKFKDTIIKKISNLPSQQKISFVDGITIYGCGEYGRIVIYLLNALGIDVKYVIDRRKIEEELYDVVPVEQFLLFDKVGCIIICSTGKNRTEMVKNLERKHYCYKEEYYFHEDIINYLYEQIANN